MDSAVDERQEKPCRAWRTEGRRYNCRMEGLKADGATSAIGLMVDED